VKSDEIKRALETAHGLRPMLRKTTDDYPVLDSTFCQFLRLDAQADTSLFIKRCCCDKKHVFGQCFSGSRINVFHVFCIFVNVFWRTGRRHSIIFQSVGLLTSGFNIHNPAHEDLENRIAETIHQDS
jgi:hypothetical protein